jgi:hypothetical protein
VISDFTHRSLVELCSNAVGPCTCQARLIELGGCMTHIAPRLPLKRSDVLWCPLCYVLLELDPAECRLTVYPIATAVLMRRQRGLS